MNGCRVEGVSQNAFLVKLLDLGYFSDRDSLPRCGADSTHRLWLSITVS